jgi:RNA polymerase sigma factor (sigma-70 family)
VSSRGEIEDLLRELAPQVLGALLRRHGALDVCEDAVQEALFSAAKDWPAEGLPDYPRAWLITVANRRLIDLVRSESARRRREERILLGAPPAESLQEFDEDGSAGRDDTLVLLLLCCHPALTPPSQIALTLRAVGGLTTAEIASAFFVPESTMAQRISRAKQTIREAGTTFSMPPPEELDQRLRAAMHVLYLVFNEGYTTTSGLSIHRPDLTREAIRLTRELRNLRPDDNEIAGLLALLILTEARRAARTTPTGDLIPLAEQDRNCWDRNLIREGVELVSEALASGPIGPYQLQAAIAAVHDEAASAEDTDWSEVLALYETLERIAPNPMATINRAVAVGMVLGPRAGLDLLATIDTDTRIANHHLLYAVRGHLLEMAGHTEEAANSFESASRRTASVPEKRYLTARSLGLRAGSDLVGCRRR